jgi:hypothetical protein
MLYFAGVKKYPIREVLKGYLCAKAQDEGLA